ncbi:MAG: hypothetical protein HY052_02510 [Proteobacteria bacterium]|nr:hypothetical protein [Pseudomonadota bacterium]
MTLLPGPEAPCPLKITLKLIAEIEHGYGSLYRLAEDLLAGTLPLTTMFDLLKICYQHAGCGVSEDFLLQQPAMELLTAVLLDILGPMERAGAATSEIAPPPARFLSEMLTKFPDPKGAGP